MKKVIVRVLPYLIMLVVTPFYNILDSLVLVDVFGCGCVPGAQSNMFNIDYNANDLRLTVYSVITILMVVLGIRVSKDFEKKILRVVYCVGIFAVNAMLTVQIWKMFMWG